MKVQTSLLLVLVLLIAHRDIASADVISTYNFTGADPDNYAQLAGTLTVDDTLNKFTRSTVVYSTSTESDVFSTLSGNTNPDGYLLELQSPTTSEIRIYLQFPNSDLSTYAGVGTAVSGTTTFPPTGLAEPLVGCNMVPVPEPSFGVPSAAVVVPFVLRRRHGASPC